MKAVQLTRNLFVLPVVIFVSSLSAQQLPAKRLSKATVDLPNGGKIEYIETSSLVVGSDVPYPRDSYVKHAEIVLKKADGNVEAVFCGPSSLGDINVNEAALPIQALVDESKFELLRSGGGAFTFYRFKRSDQGWQFYGAQEMVDLSTRGLGSMNSPFDYAKDLQLTDWGTVRVTTFDGENRFIVIGEDGAVLEHGQPFEYKHASVSEGLTEYERDKLRYKTRVSEYNEPRDANGVPMSLVASFKKQTAAKGVGQSDDQNSGATRGGVSPTARVLNAEPSSAKKNEAVFVSGSKDQFQFMALLAIVLGGLGLIVFLIIRKRTH